MDNLYDIIKNSTDVNGLPVMDKNQFLTLKEKYGKEEFRKVLLDYIKKEKPSFPLKEFSEQKVIDTFYKLQKANYKDFIMDTNTEVMEKYDDYKYPYSEYGLGVINGPSSYNYVSDSFMNELRMDCGSYGFKSPMHRWNTGEDLYVPFGLIFRNISMSGAIGLAKPTYMEAFRLATYIATQFKPIVAKTIYELCNAKTVLDTSMGWGDRLTAFYASNATHYIGCDPNPNTFARYQDMIKFYDKLTGGKKTTQLYRCGAEDLPWNEIENVDCAFTSPPYFSTERYNEGGENEEDQSWSKYDTYEKWRDNFYLPVSEKSFQSLNENGVLMVNIFDPKVKNKRYYSSDELVESLKDFFIGQIGMRIMQRPKSNLDKKEQKEFMNKVYIENVWCFSKNKDIDLFKHTRSSTLEEFLS